MMFGVALFWGATPIVLLSIFKHAISVIINMIGFQEERIFIFESLLFVVFCLRSYVKYCLIH